ncbi:hypothetical protein BKA70DRAFT_1556473 [Coprinopsis sp. MPI-PUGE-AT-0042]|nr:hypothetical protein BKA70DRAFT_1556473 [Coprinopsis sp. MPI-PUGE-AT-0042]
MVPSSPDTSTTHPPTKPNSGSLVDPRTKSSQLDVAAGGGIRLGDTPLSTVLREASEQALFESEYLMTYLRAVGTVPFLHRSHNLPRCLESIVSPSSSSSSTNQQVLLPGHNNLYELPLPVDLTVRPQRNVQVDPEVDAVHLLTLDAVLENLCKGQFKRSSALAIIDFLVRGGWITEENDVFYFEVLRVLRGSVWGGSVPVPWRSIPA